MVSVSVLVMRELADGAVMTDETEACVSPRAKRVERSGEQPWRLASRNMAAIACASDGDTGAVFFMLGGYWGLVGRGEFWPMGYKNFGRYGRGG